MIADTPSLPNVPLLSGVPDSFEGLSARILGAERDEVPERKAGPSTMTGPLISAPLSRQSAEFHNFITEPTRPDSAAIAPPFVLKSPAIAPPSRPVRPSISPPVSGVPDNSLSGIGGMMNGTAAKLAYMVNDSFTQVPAQSWSPFRVGANSSVLPLL